MRRLKKPKAVLMDVSGTLTQGTFIPIILVPYFQKNYRAYLEENIDKPRCKDVINKMRTSAEIDKSSPKILPEGTDNAALIGSVCNYVDYCLYNNKENKPFVVFRFMVWFDGYERNLITTPVYSDVAIQIQKWRLSQDIQLYVLSNGWSYATRKFLEKTSQGNLSILINDCFDTELGPLNSATTFQKLLNIIKVPSQELVFLTKSADEAKAAIEVGIIVVMVLTHRKDVEAIQENVKDQIPHVRTFNEIEFID